MKKVKIFIEDILEAAENDHRVQKDNERADNLLAQGTPLCETCGGTGNEFLFMYRKCHVCDGTGIKPISEANN